MDAQQAGLELGTIVVSVAAACWISCCADRSTVLISDSKMQVLSLPLLTQPTAPLAFLSRPHAALTEPSSWATCSRNIALAPASSTEAIRPGTH